VVLTGVPLDVRTVDRYEEMTLVSRFRTTALGAVLGALVVFVLLFPASGHDTDPPECFSSFGYVVPCGFGPEQSQGPGFAGAGAVVAALLVVFGSAAGRRDRQRLAAPSTSGDPRP
jgi:hypothetical protein